MHASMAMPHEALSQETLPLGGAVEEALRSRDSQRAVRELLDILPKDVLEELNRGSIDFKDPAFLDGLMDHVSRLAVARPSVGQRILGKVIRLKKLIARSVRESDPEIAISSTVTRQGERVGRNNPCPCGSGRKYKQCCLRKN